MPGAPEQERPSNGIERVCAVCSVPLDWFGNIDEGIWRHSAGLIRQDHPAVPVDPSELASVNWKCDFCSSDHARWALPACDFPTPDGSMSCGDWCVCDGCKAAVERRDWPAVVQRVRDTVQAAGHPVTSFGDVYLKALYVDLAQNITGDLYINPPTSRR